MGAIARALGRAKTTISRELQRNALPCHAPQMPRVQDTVPSLARRAWKGCSNPLLLTALRFAPESGQFAAWLAQSSRHQHRRHLRPCDAFPAHRKQSPAQLLKPHPAPQGERQVNVAKLPRALDANALQANGRRHMFAAVYGTAALLQARRSAGAPTRAPPSVRARRVRQDVRPSVGSPAPQHERCAPDTNSDELSRPSCESVRRKYMRHLNPQRPKRKYPRSSLHAQLRPSRTPTT